MIKTSGLSKKRDHNLDLFPTRWLLQELCLGKVKLQLSTGLYDSLLLEFFISDKEFFMPAPLKGREHIFQYIKPNNNRQGRILLILIFT